MAAGLNIADLQALLAERTGYVLSDERVYAVESRLGPLARREGFANVQALVDSLAEARRPSLVWEALEAMLPADSKFFRDREPFQVLCADLLPALAAARPGGRVRILSAGCASGQEAWSVAMCAAEKGLAAVEVLGVDLSSRALEKARSGLYTQFEVQKGLRARQLIKWFEPAEDLWSIRESLRPKAVFERRNLLDGPVGSEPFDLAFCRYVLGDMTPQARRRVLAGLEAGLARDGCLFLGSGETYPETLDAFRPVAGLRGVYVKNPASLSRAA